MRKWCPSPDKRDDKKQHRRESKIEEEDENLIKSEEDLIVNEANEILAEENNIIEHGMPNNSLNEMTREKDGIGHEDSSDEDSS